MPSPKKSIIFLGSKPVGYECLEHLLSIKEALGILVTGVVTQSRKEFGSHDLAALAVANGIPVISSIEDMPACDIIYSVQHREILKQHHIDRASQIAVNLHMAPLPEYRGCNQFSFAIIDDKKEFGTTIHRIDTRIDHGDILFEKRFQIPADCWIEELYELTEAASVALFKETLADIVHGRYTFKSQQSLLDARGSSIHYRKDIASLKEIDLSWPADKIDRHIRATSMPGFEPPYTMIGDKKIYFSIQPQ